MRQFKSIIASARTLGPLSNGEKFPFDFGG